MNYKYQPFILLYKKHAWPRIKQANQKNPYQILQTAKFILLLTSLPSSNLNYKYQSLIRSFNHAWATIKQDKISVSNSASSKIYLIPNLTSNSFVFYTVTFDQELNKRSEAD